MAIAEMRKLNLAAMAYERDAILNALQRTGAAEIKTHFEREELSVLPADCERIRSRLASAEAALDLLCAEVEKTDKERKIRSDVLKDGFEVSYTEFMSAKDKKQAATSVVTKINALTDEKNLLGTELAKCEKTIQTAEIYSTVLLPLCSFADTAHTAVRLGVVPLAERDPLLSALRETELCAFSELSAVGEQLLLLVVAHKNAVSEVEAALSSSGFVPCPFGGDTRSGAQIYADQQSQKEILTEKIGHNADEIYALRDEIRPLKVYCDYMGYELEKAELSEKLRATERTFFLEAYIPAGSEELIADQLNAVTGAVYYEFSQPSDEETPPTLMRNNKVVSNFETITNMYSPPNAREFDPSTVMAIFYSVFLGFIMGDVGYGLMMFLGGGAIYWKTRARDSGLKRLSGVFAIGGILAIVWGLLFNSFFGIALEFMPTVMPDAQNDMWSLAGIRVPAVLVISLLIGTVQLFAGYVCKAVQCWRRGQILDGICDGVTWAVFSVGVALAILGFVEEVNLSVLTYVGGVLAAVGLVSAMLTAGRKEKLVGKFTKGFGAAYGVINYASDILSYARLYGLMLSGAVIAQIVSQYGVQFITGGSVAFVILGILLMVVGHVFNLAMNLLGAYIHDARLQYVEFYGRFYEGEGELFAPLGSKHKYIYLTA